MAQGLIDIVEELGERAGDIIASLCTDLCHVEAASLEDDGDGGKRRGDYTSLTEDPLPCIAYPDKPGRLHDKGGPPKGKAWFIVIVRGDVAATSKHRVRILARARHAEQVVEVVEVRPVMGVITEIVGLVAI